MGQTITRARLLKEVYEEIALCLGGIFAAQDGAVPEGAVRDVCRGLGQLYRRHQARYVQPGAGGEQGRGGDGRAHPAMVQLLEQLQDEGGET